MKKIYLAIFLLASLQLPAQTCEWAKSPASTLGSYAGALTTDKLGNTYVLAGFKGTATLGAFTLTSSGTSSNIYIAKYNPSGGVVWAKKIRTTGDPSVGAIKTDLNGHLFITGGFKDSIIFENSFKALSKGVNDIFIAKFDTSGTYKWAKSYGKNSNDQGNSLATDTTGNVYVAGFYGSNIDFGTIHIDANTFGQDGYVAKFDGDGNPIWATGMGSGTTIAYAMDIDALGNSYVTGKYSGTGKFGTFTLKSNKSSLDLFMVKLTSSGVVEWANSVGNKDFDQGEGIATDALGNSYVTGFTMGTVTFGDKTLTGSGSQSMFIAKYTNVGSVEWVKNYGGTEGYSIDLDAQGNLAVTGYYSVSAVFGTTTLTSLGAYDAYLAKFDGSGNPLWAVGMGGKDSDFGNFVTSDPSGNTFVAGTFAGEGTFSQFKLNSTQADLFIVKFNSTVTGVMHSESQNSEFSISPNPAIGIIHLSSETTKIAKVEISDLSGKKIYESAATNETTIDCSGWGAGIYLMKIISDTGSIAYKKVVVQK